MKELTPKQYSFLCLLNNSKYRNLSVSKIGKEIFRTWRSISLVVNLFEELQLIEVTDGRDKKQMYVIVTPKGSEYIQEYYKKNIKIYKP